jgi:hypothetical protein
MKHKRKLKAMQARHQVELEAAMAVEKEIRDVEKTEKNIIAKLTETTKSKKDEKLAKN